LSLQGTFDVLDFAELLALLARKRASGRLHLRSGTLSADLYFKDGALLTQSVPAGDGQSTREEIARLEAVCLEFLRGARATFEFDQRWSGSGPKGRMVKVDALLNRTRRRLQEWREIEAVIPSLEIQPRVVTELGSTQVTLDRNRWRLLTAIDGRRSVHSLAHALDMSTYQVCKLLKALVEDGVVDVAPKRRKPAPPLAADNTEKTPQGHIRVRSNTALANGNGRSSDRVDSSGN
jgi:hypothetical protein